MRKLNVEDEDAKYSFEDRMEQVKDTLVASVNEVYENEASMGRIRMITMIFATIGSIIGGILVVLFLIPVIRGIKSVQSATKLVAAGDFTQEIKVTSKDEIGQLQETFYA